MSTSAWNAIFGARTKLDAYIDALWSARFQAPDSLKIVYTERLAFAARFTSLLRYLRSTSEIQQLVKEENERFPREILATEEGRLARSAFNLFARDAIALEGYRAPDGSIHTGPDMLVGEQLSSVSFVMDYVQLDFNGQNFQVFCPIVIRGPDWVSSQKDAGFRDRICQPIGRIVRRVDVTDTTVIVLFDEIRIELVFGSDGAGAEPLIFFNRDHQAIYFP